jgi:hypothetical protein
VYFECKRCLHHEYDVDVSLGCEGSYSDHARRLISLAGASYGFETAEKCLEEMTGLKLSANTINKLSCEVGAAMKTWTRESKELHDNFAQTVGNTEFTTDGVMVRTTTDDSWEVKVAVFAKRPAGDPRTAENWKKTPLPKVKKKIAVAQIVTSKRLASSLPHWQKRLKLHAPWDVRITADGAKWIENMCVAHFPNADILLDIYHACDHVQTMLKNLFPRDEKQRKEHFEKMRHAVLSRGWEGLYDEFESLKTTVGDSAWTHHVSKTFAYFEARRARLNYPKRLAAGLPIGSGLIEGSCKQIVTRRLKPSAGCRWRIRTVNRMLGVLTALYTDTWGMFWKKPR